MTNIHATIRPYKLTDYEEVKKNLLDADMYEDDMYTEEHLRKKIERDERSILVAEVDGKAIGNIFISTDWAPILFALAVRTPYRKKGIGKQLVEAAVAEGKAQGIPYIYLLVREDRLDLQARYGKWGFVKNNVFRWMTREIK
jgi:predicted N-acetyltransferase YhbS